MNAGVQFLKGDFLDTALSQPENLARSFLLLLLMIIALEVLSYLLSILRSRNVEKITHDLRCDIAAAVLFRRRSALKDMDSSAVITHYSSEIFSISYNYLFQGLKFVEFALSLVIISTALFSIDTRAAILALILSAAPLLVTKTYQKKLSADEEDFLGGNRENVKYLRSLLHGLEAIKNYSIEDAVTERFGHSLANLRRLDKLRSRRRAGSNGLSFLSTLLAQLVLAIYAGYAVYTGRLTPGNFVSIFSLSASLSQPLYWITKCYQSMISARPAIDSVVGFIEQAERERDESPADSKLKYTPAEILKGEPEDESLAATTPYLLLEAKDNLLLQAECIAFSYDENSLIENLSFELRRGEKLLISGESGSGKSSLVDLLLGYRIPQKGLFRFYGVSPESIIVSRQDAFLFAGTLRDNLSLFDPEITDDAMEEMLIRVGLSELLETQGLDSIVAEGGKNFSGGEAKRISLARAFLRPGPLLILDEPLANIDPENIARVEDLILESRGRSLLIISHQLSDRLIAGIDAEVKLGGGVHA